MKKSGVIFIFFLVLIIFFYNNINKHFLLCNIMVNDELKRELEKRLGMGFEDTQRLCPSELRAIIERRNGRPARLAVPIYHNGVWEDDMKRICDPNAAFDLAVKEPWYTKLYRAIFG